MWEWAPYCAVVVYVAKCDVLNVRIVDDDSGFMGKAFLNSHQKGNIETNGFG